MKGEIILREEIAGIIGGILEVIIEVIIEGIIAGIKEGRLSAITATALVTSPGIARRKESPGSRGIIGEATRALDASTARSLDMSLEIVQRRSSKIRR